MKKVIFIGVFSTPNSTNVSQSRGFSQNDVEVINYDYREKARQLGGIQNRDLDLITLIQQTKPDLVVFSKCNMMSHVVVDEANKVSKTCMWMMDASHNFDPEMTEKAKRVNFYISGVEGVTDIAKRYCDNTHFVNQCFDDEFNFKMDDVDYDTDISFIGSADTSKIHENRKKYVDFLKSQYSSFKHFNNVYGLEHNEVVNKTKINLNFSPTDATGASVRIYKIMASGGFLMSTPWKDMEKTFEIDKDIVIFNDESELKEKIDFYLNNDELREEIRNNFYKKSKEYSPKVWANRILKYCNVL